MENLVRKKRVISVWQLEDYDCNHWVYVNVEDAFDAAVKMIEDSHNGLEDKYEMMKQLAHSFIEREKYSCKGFSVDDFLWVYKVDLMLDEYEEEEQVNEE